VFNIASGARVNISSLTISNGAVFGGFCVAAHGGSAAGCKINRHPHWKP
jgi:hypothetical protein